MNMTRLPWMTDDVAQFRDAALRYLADRIAPRVPGWIEAKRVDRQTWLDLGAMGMLLPELPEELGGSGAPISFQAALIDAMAETGVLPSLGVSVHAIVAHYLLAYASEAQKQRWLPHMASGEMIAAIAMSEPGAGSDLQGVRTQARREGDDYVINGSKTFITNGSIADIICVVVKTDLSAGAKGISLVMVETVDLPGFKVGRVLDKIGMMGSDTAELFFDDVRVPVDNLIGNAEGRGFYQLMEQLPFERTILGLMAVAAMERAVTLTADYVAQRKAFGKTLLELQNTRFKLAECKTIATIGRVFLNDCVQRLCDGTLDSATASMAKWWGSQMQCDIIDECLQLFGGYGYMREYPIAEMYADARVQKIYGGTNEIMKELIARSLEAQVR
jgi:acyl-CoA dehydrogenase